MNELIFIGLINNAALLLALGLIYDSLYRRNRSPGSTVYQIVSGLCIGGMAIMLMVTPVKLEAGIIFDTRTILLGVASLYFGAVPAFIAMATAAAYRLYLGGSGALMGVATIISAGLIGLLWRHYRCRGSRDLSLAELYLFGLVIHAVMLLCMLFLPRELVRAFFSNLALPVILIFPVATALLGTLLANRQKRYLVEEDLRKSEEEFKAIANYAASWEAWFDSAGKLKWMNPYSVKLTGYSPEEYIAAEDYLSMTIAAEDRAVALENLREPSKATVATTWKSVVCAKTVQTSGYPFPGNRSLMLRVVLSVFAPVRRTSPCASGSKRPSAKAKINSQRLLITSP